MGPYRKQYTSRGRQLKLKLLQFENLLKCLKIHSFSSSSSVFTEASKNNIPKNTFQVNEAKGSDKERLTRLGVTIARAK